MMRRNAGVESCNEAKLSQQRSQRYTEQNRFLAVSRLGMTAHLGFGIVKTPLASDMRDSPDEGWGGLVVF